MQHLHTGWERAFQRQLPHALDHFVRTTRTLLEKFHREATAKARERGFNPHGLAMLAQQTQAYAGRISDLRAIILGLTQELQREANRGFTPIIQDEMTLAYDECVAERGMFPLTGV